MPFAVFLSCFATSLTFRSSEWIKQDMRCLICHSFSWAQMYAVCIRQWYVSVCVWQYSECFGLRQCPWINACSCVSICLHAHFSVCSPLDTCFFFFFTYWKLFLEWPSKSHAVQPCCLCAPACVIQLEWRKPRDTSVALSRLRSSTVCRWFFDGANLEALWLKGSGLARGEQSVKQTYERQCTRYI